jgi:hypothetical protein
MMWFAIYLLVGCVLASVISPLLIHQAAGPRHFLRLMFIAAALWPLFVISALWHIARRSLGLLL